MADDHDSRRAVSYLAFKSGIHMPLRFFDPVSGNTTIRNIPIGSSEAFRASLVSLLCENQELIGLKMPAVKQLVDSLILTKRLDSPPLVARVDLCIPPQLTEVLARIDFAELEVILRASASR